MLEEYAKQLCNRAYRGKLDLSGVVQQTLIEAAEATPPAEPAGVLNWLRALCKRNYLDAVKRLKARKRSVTREVPLAGVDRPGREVTPSKSAVRAEDVLAMA